MSEETCTAASTVHPSTKTDRVASMCSLRVVEQPDAPFDRRPQRALALGKIDRAGTQGVEATFEPSEQCARFQQPCASRGELDGERQTIEAPADLDDGQRVVLGQRRSRSGRPGLDRRTAARPVERGQLFHRWPLREPGHRERADRILPLGPEPKHGAARRQDLEVGTAGQELVELGCDTHDLFEVVQHEQRRSAAKCSTRTSSAGREPSMVALTAAAMRGSTSSGWAIASSATNTVPCG